MIDDNMWRSWYGNRYVAIDVLVEADLDKVGIALRHAAHVVEIGGRCHHARGLATSARLAFAADANKTGVVEKTVPVALPEAADVDAVLAVVRKVHNLG